MGKLIPPTQIRRIREMGEYEPILTNEAKPVSMNFIPLEQVCKRYKVSVEEAKEASKNSTDIVFGTERIGVFKKRDTINDRSILPMLSNVVRNRCIVSPVVNYNGTYEIFVTTALYSKPLREYFGLSKEDFVKFYLGHSIGVVAKIDDFHIPQGVFGALFSMLFAEYEGRVVSGETKKASVTRNEAKSKVKRKFRVGELISLKSKPIGNSRETIKGYKVKQCVYTINGCEVNAVVVKQIYGLQDKIYTLNRHDCEKLHVKFEPGLQLYSMMMNWGVFHEEKYCKKQNNNEQ